ncbi:MAG TPA: IPT/TIG domain-containing protein [Candidatus Paceibacterota bacterium]|nr:IPT/TIG domain-containing protein [Candidatus Paceibacterota bacterium]
MKKLIVSGVVALSLVAGVASAQTYYPTNYSYSSGACLSVSTGLTVGSRGSQVLALQQFLVSQNYPGSGSWMETSYFGNATRAALIDFQQAQGLPQTGYVDSATLSALQNVSCGGGSSYVYPGYPGYTSSYTYPYSYQSYPYTYGYGTPTITSLSQNTGVPGNTITIYGQGFDPYNNTVFFAGQSYSGVPSSGGTSLSFTIPYLYSYSNNQSVQLYVTDSRGTSNTVSFTLNPSVSGGCTTYPYSYGVNCGCAYPNSYGYNYGAYPYNYNNYNCNPIPNTGTPVITYIAPQSGGVGTSVTIYGSGFTTNGNTVHFGNGIVTSLGSSDGRSLSFVVPSQITGYGSQPLVLGTYQISVTNSNGASSNSMPFTVTSTVNSNNAPVITSVSGPNAIQTGAQGVWTLNLNTQGNSYTTVSVNWGDSSYYNASQPTSQVVYNGSQTITFTHTYYTSGTFTLAFTANNQNGQSNSYTSTVVVSGSSNYGGAPIITYLAPQSGAIGTQVTIYGSNFSTSGGNTVNFGNGAIQNVFSNGNSLTFVVPSYTTPYCTPGLYCGVQPTQVLPGTYNVSVMDQYGTSNTIPFTVY